MDYSITEVNKSREIMDNLIAKNASVGLADFSINYYANNERYHLANKYSGPSIKGSSREGNPPLT